MKSSEIRQAFFDYFTAKGHTLVESSSLIPGNDPTLLFTNAGMVQFKDVFLGQETRPYTRAVSAQRCVRAGGKHNDLENVGYTARHHTFFEMLGNFSFGDYFKREAIGFAWEFLTGILKLPEEKLWVTVYQDDDEAADIWLKEMGISPKRFSRCGEKDNFWTMGDTGPCGPCTEIFYDHGEEIAGGPPGSPDADGDRYIEIWNLVFMQYNKDKKGRLHPLPNPSVDTGMGLERIAAVVQGKHNNYDIDSFRHIISAIHAQTALTDVNHPSLRVIADHCRASSFLIADGVVPGNEGRGYVLRRIIRRAVRHGNKLNLPTPFLCYLIDPLADVMGGVYPILNICKDQITHIIAQEEHQFSKTLDQGLRLLKEQIDNMTGDEISGSVAFKLYDTYGFPLDLTEDIAREQNLTVDVAGFQACMQQQRELSQTANQFSVDYSGADILEEVSGFHGYHEHSLNSRVSALLADGKKVEQVTEGMEAAVVLENTPFYAESGGQVGDTGQLLDLNTQFEVHDTKKLGQAILHYGKVLKGALRPGQDLLAQIDLDRRSAIRLNHTATHLLHAALRQILGSHVQQKGSLVDAERARFDFSHFEALTPNEIRHIEMLVNDKIRANQVVHTEHMNLEMAKKSGAVALFGEKYSEDVRVLSIADFSRELCGGTHVKQTGDIGLFKITAEYGVASGVRRIEMVTGSHALNWVNQQLTVIREAGEKLKANPENLLEKLDQLMKENSARQKDLNTLQEKLAAYSGQALLSEVQKIGQTDVLIKELKSATGQTLRSTLDQLKSRLDNAVIVLYSIEEDKINVIAGVSPKLTGTVPTAAELVKTLCGKGGGRPDMAQGGGVLPSDLPGRLEKIKAMIKMPA